MIPNVKGFMFSEEIPLVEVSANSNGYRDTEWKSKKGKKILVLGDSFGWGWGCKYEDTIASTVDKVLGDEWTTYNLSIPGEDIYKLYSRYRYFHKVIKPDHVLILNYINDFFRQKMQQQKIAEARTRYEKFDGNMNCEYWYDKTVLDYLDDYSYIYRLMNRVRNSAGISFSSKERKRKFLKIGYQSDIDLLSSPQRIDDAFDMYLPLIKEMSQFQRITIVNIPTSYEIEELQYKELAEVFDLRSINVNAVNDAFKTKLESLPNVSFIDLLDLLRSEGKKSNLYFKQDGHLTSRGQTISGEFIAAKLKPILNGEN